MASWIARRLGSKLRSCYVQAVELARQTQGAIPYLEGAREVQQKLAEEGDLTETVLANGTTRIAIPHDYHYVKEKFCKVRGMMVPEMTYCPTTNTMVPVMRMKKVTVVSECRDDRCSLVLEFGTECYTMTVVAAP